MNVLTNLVENSDIKLIYSDARRNEKKTDKTLLELLDKLSLACMSPFNSFHILVFCMLKNVFFC